VTLIEDVTDRALVGEFEPVVCLEAPEWPALPDYLIREDLDRASVYTRPGSQRFATRVQLSLEERLVADAQRVGAPHLSCEQIAAELGADSDALLAALRQRAEGTAGSGLRMDQASALAYVLGSPRTAEVMVGKAGSGKTRVLAEAARAWISATGGQVIGLATAQSARNVLAGAGVELAQNTAVFLGHLPGERGALGITDLAPGSLILIDEASMMSSPDLADIIFYAVARGRKVLVAGDTAQLQAVESGGGLALLTRENGHVQLTEVVRMKEQWEQEASLGLWAAEASALAEYDAHGRITGGSPDAGRTLLTIWLAMTCS